MISLRSRICPRLAGVTVARQSSGPLQRIAKPESRTLTAVEDNLIGASDARPLPAGLMGTHGATMPKADFSGLGSTWHELEQL